jgi:uncharacterized protein
MRSCARAVLPNAFRWRTKPTSSSGARPDAGAPRSEKGTPGNTELLLRGYEAFGAGDVQSTLELMDPDIEVAVFTGRPGMGRQTYHGHAGFFENLGEMTEVFDDFRFEAQEMVEHGDRVLVTVRVTGRGKSSGAEIEGRLFHVWLIRDGKAVRFEIYNDRDEAETALKG